MTTPEHVYDYDMRTRARVVRKVQEVPSGHDPADYVTRRITATSRDGMTVPVSLLHRRGTAIDGSAPLLLYGYGSYGISVPASFGTTWLSLVDRGFVFALAHVRGGTECGYAWYTNGKLARKSNTFHDFIAAAQALVEHGYARKGRIGIHGGSAGGLLVGACANMAPDLFDAVIAEVPFVDVLNTICDDTLPLTPPEWPEWGNPLESVEAYDRIAAYSPYDNVEAKGYPHIIAHRGAHRPPRHLLGTRQVGGEAARDQDRRAAARAPHQHGGGARRRGGPLRPTRGDRPRLRVRAARLRKMTTTCSSAGRCTPAVVRRARPAARPTPSRTRAPADGPISTGFQACAASLSSSPSTT